ncbi:MAG: trehalose-6-phosphate synthase [Elusimicrobia bacterium]|nr:trehalose-6-phosphate synthase [Elusimicrobiota bacterium]
MRITLRLIVSLISVVASVAFFSAYLQVGHEQEKQQEELERRSRLLAESLQETIEPIMKRGASSNLQRIVERFGNRERLAGVAVYDTKGNSLAITSSLASALPVAPQAVTESLKKSVDVGAFDTIHKKEMHLYALPLRARGKTVGALTLFHDATYIQTHLSQIWRRTFFRIIVQMVLIAIVTLLIVRWSFVGPIAQIAEWMKQLRSGESVRPLFLPKENLFAPLTREATTLARHLSTAKSAVEEEAKLRQTAESLWTPDRLKEHIRTKLHGRPLFVLSNREPYMHLHRDRRIEAIVPAGGLVTALEPILRACGGTWIAHGAGDADWEVVDEAGRIKVPPDDPRYVLKRVALSKEEETGYYYGFSNEGLWPLCHIAHNRPVFRPEDWEHYQKVNLKFVQAALEELENVEEPCVLVQDYHFALFPRLLKERRPDARIALFWHIPWPNPEAFGICPWQREILYGMLGADLIGFHTQFHCNNFLDTVDRALESRIDWERFAVQKGRHTTLVKPFPISVAFPSVFQDIPAEDGPGPDRGALLKELGLKVKYLGVGVERMDYTKGVLERFRAIERFLEKHTRYQKEFTFVQLGAPSRAHIRRYHDFLAEVEAEAERINWKFKLKEWRPIIFLKKHHSHQEILPYYRNADFCMVTSLHDGMNLVAKEFVASREDEGGVLILSQFAGASRELRDALIVNPYDAEQTAEAIRYALEMDSEERFARMRRMRETVREHNIYRWAGNLITELIQIRLEQQPVERIT